MESTTINLILQNLGLWLLLPMKAFSFLGQTEFFLILLPAVYWCIDTGAGMQIGIILMLSANLGSILKISFHGSRPYWIDPRVQALATEMTFGFPSLHATMSLSFFGLIAVLLKKYRLVVIGAVVVILLVGFSRVYLGVHYFTDVLGGWLLGGMILFLFLRWRSPVAGWFNTQAMVKKIGFISAVVFVLIVLATIARLSLGDWQAPQAWLQNTSGDISPLNLKDCISTAGVLFGLIVGLAWMNQRAGFSSLGPIPQRILRYLVGLVGVFVIWFGLGQVFPKDASISAYILNFIRYALVGMWVTAGAPVLFLKLKLAQIR